MNLTWPTKCPNDFFSGCYWRLESWNITRHLQPHGQANSNLHEWGPGKETSLWTSHPNPWKNEEVKEEANTELISTFNSLRFDALNLQLIGKDKAVLKNSGINLNIFKALLLTFLIVDYEPLVRKNSHLFQRNTHQHYFTKVGLVLNPTAWNRCYSKDFWKMLKKTSDDFTSQTKTTLQCMLICM